MLTGASLLLRDRRARLFRRLTATGPLSLLLGFLVLFGTLLVTLTGIVRLQTIVNGFEERLHHMVRLLSNDIAVPHEEESHFLQGTILPINRRSIALAVRHVPCTIL